MSKGDENDSKIIRLALGSDENENAFQQHTGLGTDMIFDINDAILRARIMGRIMEIFRRFEAQNRYRLIPNTIKWSENSAEQELILSLRYFNMESDEEKPFTQSFRSGGR